MEAVVSGWERESINERAVSPAGGENEEHWHQGIEQVKPVAPRVAIHVVGRCDDPNFPFFGRIAIPIERAPFGGARLRNIPVHKRFELTAEVRLSNDLT